jgi:hypothetical protein
MMRVRAKNRPLGKVQGFPTVRAETSKGNLWNAANCAIHSKTPFLEIMGEGALKFFFFWSQKASSRLKPSRSQTLKTTERRTEIPKHIMQTSIPPLEAVCINALFFSGTQTTEKVSPTAFGLY